MERYRHLLTSPKDFSPICREPDVGHVTHDVLSDVAEGKVSPRFLEAHTHMINDCELCHGNAAAFKATPWYELPTACLRCGMLGMCEFNERPQSCESHHVCNSTYGGSSYRGLPCGARGGFPTFDDWLEQRFEAPEIELVAEGYCGTALPALTGLTRDRVQRPRYRNLNLLR